MMCIRTAWAQSLQEGSSTLETDGGCASVKSPSMGPLKPDTREMGPLIPGEREIQSLLFVVGSFPTAGTVESLLGLWLSKWDGWGILDSTERHTCA